jgi:Zn-dependent M28 family amino/carboxypeptidase
VRVKTWLAAVVVACLGCGVTLPPRQQPGDPARLEASVRALSQRFHPRDASHPANLDAAAAWLRGELERAGARVSEQSWQTDGETYRNVIARFGPESGELVIVGAHYDTCEPLPGADDNASGVAALLELARLLGAQAPPGPVELVAYSLEEPPFFRTRHMGSVHHADSLAAGGVPVRAMLALEMVGYFSDAPDSQTYPADLLSWLYPDEGSFIAVVGNMANGSLVRRVARAMRASGAPIPVESLRAPESLAGVDFSDHRSYWARGFPAAMITDTSFYRNANYHRATDTAETLDYQRMAAVVTALHAAVWSLASDD